MQLNVLTWNTLFAGRDGMDDSRAQKQIEVVNDLSPDIFLMQEAKGFEANGGASLFELENAIGMRGFLAKAANTGQNVAIFLRAPLRPLAFEADSAHFHHALAKLRVEIPGIESPLTVLSAHLCPSGAHVRRREASYLTMQSSIDELVLLTGDFNSASPHDPEPADWAALAPLHRARYVSDDLKRIDHSVLAHLEAAGWIDLGHRLDCADVPTVPTAAYRDAEFATMRCDYLMSSAALATAARQYEVIRTEITEVASDHYPVRVRFEF